MVATICPLAVTDKQSSISWCWWLPSWWWWWWPRSQSSSSLWRRQGRPTSSEALPPKPRRFSGSFRSEWESPFLFVRHLLILNLMRHHIRYEQLLTLYPKLSLQHLDPIMISSMTLALDFRWRHVHYHIAIFVSSVDIELVYSSARVTSVKSQKGLWLTHIQNPDPYIGTPGYMGWIKPVCFEEQPTFWNPQGLRGRLLSHLGWWWWW